MFAWSVKLNALFENATRSRITFSECSTAMPETEFASAPLNALAVTSTNELSFMQTTPFAMPELLDAVRLLITVEVLNDILLITSIRLSVPALETI